MHDPFFSSQTLHSLVGSLHKVHPLVRYDNLAMNSETKECLVMRLLFVILLLLWRDLLRFVRCYPLARHPRGSSRALRKRLPALGKWVRRRDIEGGIHNECASEGSHDFDFWGWGVVFVD